MDFRVAQSSGVSPADAGRDRVVSSSEPVVGAVWHGEASAAAVLDSIGDGVLTTDAAGNVVCLNRAAESMTGWLRGEAKGRPFSEVLRLVNRTTGLPPEDPVALTIARGTSCSLAANTVLIARDGTESEIEDSAAPIRAADGRVTGAVLIFRHVGRVRAVAVEMSHRAHHDFLTGLPNPVLLADRIGQAIEAARRHGSRLALLFVDIDNFKSVNDALGHTVGDALLRSIAERLKTCVRISDTVCRRSGDEFVVLLSEIARSEDAARSAAKLIAAVASPHEIAGANLLITASVGIAVYPLDGTRSEKLLFSADEAMYQAKRNGRNCCWFATPKLKPRSGVLPPFRLLPSQPRPSRVGGTVLVRSTESP
jgi:diguanylate cyclase (GGDEF)-like protein/PAS domain S-box-containing protein